jgi:hypothetical protein
VCRKHAHEEDVDDIDKLPWTLIESGSGFYLIMST